MEPTRRGTKFGLLSLGRASSRIAGSVDLGATPGEIVAHAQCPIEVPAHWREWLGTLKTAEIAEANLTIAIQVESALPDVLDAESRDIEKRLERFWHGLRLNGVPKYSTARIALGGINEAGELSVRQVFSLGMSYHHICGVTLQIDDQALRKATSFGETIQAIHTGNPDYRRLRAGYSALVAGIEEPRLEERLHQFVRALDGLMAIRPGPVQAVFVQRGTTFVSGTAIDDVLRQMYQLRNTQEHLNDFHAVVNAPDEREFQRVVSLRGYQAEQAALTVYRRLFETPAAQAHFISEPSTDAFWQLPEAQRSAVWGPRFDLDPVEADHNHRFQFV